MGGSINRLTKKKDYDRVFKSGRSSFNKIIGIKAVSNDLGITRFGIIVGSKTAKLAVRRNKIKRQIREIIKKKYYIINMGLDVVIIALPAILACNFSQIKESIDKNFKKIANIK